MLKPQAHIIKFFVLSLFVGFMMLDFASTLHVVFKDVKKSSQVLANEEEDTEEAGSDESSEKEEKSGKENLSSFLAIGEIASIELASNISFIRYYSEDTVKDCHLSLNTPPPEL